MKTQAKKLPRAQMRGYVGHAQYYNGEFTGWGVISKKRHNGDTHYLAVIPCSTRKQARALVRLHNFTDPGVRALAGACEALNGCKNRRELNATISFIVDRFITHPAKELPPHLTRALCLTDL